MNDIDTQGSPLRIFIVEAYGTTVGLYLPDNNDMLHWRPMTDQIAGIYIIYHNPWTMVPGIPASRYTGHLEKSADPKTILPERMNTGINL